MKHLIIDRPSWQTTRQRLVFGSMTAIFWALWIYLWLPILALVGWALGFRIAYYQMIVKDGYIGLFQLLGIYALIIFCLGATLLAWAYYNYFRFRGVERRKPRPPISLDDLSQRYQLAPEILGNWALARRIVLHHSPDGRVIGAD